MKNAYTQKAEELLGNMKDSLHKELFGKDYSTAQEELLIDKVAELYVAIATQGYGSIPTWVENTAFTITNSAKECAKMKKALVRVANLALVK